MCVAASLKCSEAQRQLTCGGGQSWAASVQWEQSQSREEAPDLRREPAPEGNVTTCLDTPAPHKPNGGRGAHSKHNSSSPGMCQGLRGRQAQYKAAQRSEVMPISNRDSQKQK